jgi:hypothetical protein
VLGKVFLGTLEKIFSGIKLEITAAVFWEFRLTAADRREACGFITINHHEKNTYRVMSENSV